MNEIKTTIDYSFHFTGERVDDNIMLHIEHRNGDRVVRDCMTIYQQDIDLLIEKLKETKETISKINKGLL